MGQHGFVNSRVLFRLHDHKFFGREMPRTGIVVAGDHGGAVIGCVFTNKDRCTSHSFSLRSFKFRFAGTIVASFAQKGKSDKKPVGSAYADGLFRKKKNGG